MKSWSKFTLKGTKYILNIYKNKNEIFPLTLKHINTLKIDFNINIADPRQNVLMKLSETVTYNIRK